MLKLPEGYGAIVTSGAAAAMQSGLAASSRTTIRKFIEQLPDLTGMKSEVIIQKSHRNPFDHQLRSTGIKLVVIESRDDLKRPSTRRTAMMHFTNFADADGQIQVEEWVKLAHENQISAFIVPPPIRLPYPVYGITQTWATTSSPSAVKSDARAAMRGTAHWQERSSRVRLLNNSPHEDHSGTQPESGQGRNRRHGSRPWNLI